MVGVIDGVGSCVTVGSGVCGVSLVGKSVGSSVGAMPNSGAGVSFVFTFW